MNKINKTSFATKFVFAAKVALTVVAFVCVMLVPPLVVPVFDMIWGE